MAMADEERPQLAKAQQLLGEGVALLRMCKHRDAERTLTEALAAARDAAPRAEADAVEQRALWQRASAREWLGDYGAALEDLFALPWSPDVESRQRHNRLLVRRRAARQRDLTPGPRLGSNGVLRVVEDAVKGRTVLAGRDVARGEAVNVEDAAVIMSRSRCFTCCGEHDACPEAVMQDGPVLDVLPKLAAIPWDVASLRVLLRVVHDAASSPPSTRVLDLLLGLRATGVRREHARAAALFRAALPASHRDAVPLPRLQWLLAALGQNQFEVAPLDGIAVFASTAMFEHACAPNCSWSIEMDEAGCRPRVHVIAIDNVAACTPLTISYILPYLTRPMRQASLQRGYDFTCECAMCGTERDRARSFVCRRCPSDDAAPVTAVGDGREPGNWSCEACGRKPTSDDFAAWIAEEDALGRLEPQARDMARILNGGLLHESHRVVYESLLAQGELLAGVEKTRLMALDLWARIVRAQDRVLGEWDVERVKTLDELAQVHVALGNGDKAKRAYERAVDIARVACTGTRRLAQLESLLERPPTSVDELVAIYGAPDARTKLNVVR